MPMLMLPIFTSCSTSSIIVDPVIRLSHFAIGLPAFTDDTTFENKTLNESAMQDSCLYA